MEDLEGLKDGQKRRYKTVVKELNEEFNSLKTEVKTFLDEINSNAPEAPGYKKQIINTVEEVQNKLRELKKKAAELDELYSFYLDEDEETDESRKDKVEAVYTEIVNYSNQLEKVKSKVVEFEALVFGDNNEGGVKQRVLSTEKEIHQKQEVWEKNFQTLYNKIEGLLPGATSAGLAKAYEEQAGKYSTPYLIWSIVFISSIVLMICFAVHTFPDTDHIPKDINSAIIALLSRLPFFIPAIWVAAFAAKQQSQNKRLEQEYAHKASIAKTYEGHKREIQNLPDADVGEELTEKLLTTMVSNLENNPSNTLSDSRHNDDTSIFSQTLDKVFTSKKKGSDDDK